MVCGPKVLGLVWSNPLSSVTSASVPASPGSATSRTGVWVTTSSNAGVVCSLMPRPPCRVVRPVVGVVGVLPDHGAAHADADAHGGHAVAHLGVLLELPGQLGHQTHAGGGERVAGGDGAAVLVDARVVVGDAEVLEEGEHLHGEGLVELEQADVVDGEPGLAQRLLGGRHRADAHDLGLDADEGEVDQAHPHRQPELRGGLRPRRGCRPWHRR